MFDFYRFFSAFPSLSQRVYYERVTDSQTISHCAEKWKCQWISPMPITYCRLLSLHIFRLQFSHTAVLSSSHLNRRRCCCSDSIAAGPSFSGKYRRKKVLTIIRISRKEKIIWRQTAYARVPEVISTTRLHATDVPIIWQNPKTRKTCSRSTAAQSPSVPVSKFSKGYH